MRRIPVFAFLPLALSACAADQLPRNVYEGAKTYNESFNGTPFERRGLPVYDLYEKERRGGGARQP